MDPISDMLIRIKNAQAVLHPTVEIPFSNFKYELAKILAKNGFIGTVEKKGRKTKKYIEIALKYKEGIRAISGLRKVSKPGQRIYTNFKKIRKVKGGYGMAIISTPKGLMTDREAKKQKLGGEIVCEIW